MVYGEKSKIKMAKGPKKSNSPCKPIKKTIKKTLQQLVDQQCIPDSIGIQAKFGNKNVAIDIP